MEKCQRCGEIGQDRRTLKMACFYAMEELKVPFEKQTARIGTNPIETVYTLRVCKQCRGVWLSAIEKWFNNPIPAQEQTETHCVPVRENGTVIWLTKEEFNKRYT